VHQVGNKYIVILSSFYEAETFFRS